MSALCYCACCQSRIITVQRGNRELADLFEYGHSSVDLLTKAVETVDVQREGSEP